MAAALIWVLVNGPVEGPTLLVLAPSHGITVADLPSLAALSHRWIASVLIEALTRAHLSKIEAERAEAASVAR